MTIICGGTLSANGIIGLTEVTMTVIRGGTLSENGRTRLTGTVTVVTERRTLPTNEVIAPIVAALETIQGATEGQHACIDPQEGAMEGQHACIDPQEGAREGQHACIDPQEGAMEVVAVMGDGGFCPYGPGGGLFGVNPATGRRHGWHHRVPRGVYSSGAVQ